jgi:hypothetical protein
LPFAGLLSRVLLSVPRLLIRGPQREKMGDDHAYGVSDGQRRRLLADTYCATPQGAPQAGGRFPSAPGPWHQDPAEGAIPRARFASVPLPGTLMVPWTYPGPRRQARGVSTTAQVRPHLGDAVPCRGAIHPGHTVERRDWRLPRGPPRAALRSEGGQLPLPHLHQLHPQGPPRPMVRRALACTGEGQLRALVLQGPER